MKHVYKYLLILTLVLCLSALWGCGEKVPQQQDTPDDPQQTAPDGGDTADQPVVLSDEIECSNGSTTLRFIRTGDETWAWKDDRTFPLDNTYVQHLLSSVDAMLAAQPITTDKTVEDLGLDAEDKYVTSSNEKGEQITWYLGDKDDAGRYYMRRADDASNAIYLSPADLSAQINRSIYDMMLLPQLSAIPMESLRSVVIESGEKTVELRPNSMGVLTSDVADTQPLTALLAQPRLSACVDFQPSDGVAAICGLEPAAAVMTATYVNAFSEECTFTLLIGKALSGGYCVRVNEDTTVYRMDATSVEAVLAFVQ